MSGLYVHLPVCRSKCIYCDFYSVAVRTGFEKLIDGLIKEYEFRKHEVEQPFSTIYLGGGTPSMIPAAMLSTLFEALPVGEAREITIEINPEDATPGNIEAWRQMGVNRVSMGVQTLSDTILKKLGRRHTSRDAMQAIDNLHRGEIGNVSVDLIYGLPGLSESLWRESLRKVFQSGVTHLSAYCLTYHEGTTLYRLWQQGRVEPADDETVERQFSVLREESSKAGFEHYEISNLALPGFRSAHNSSYWKYDSTWLGIGPSAHSYDGQTRRIDFADTTRWLENLPAPFDVDQEDETDRINDYIVSGLRTLEGVDLLRLAPQSRQSLLNRASPFIAQGDMAREAGNLRINPDRWLISDFYIRHLLLDKT